MPAQTVQAKVSTTVPVHYGETFGVTPNPNATRPATIAAIGNPYGGNSGYAVAPARSAGLDRHRQWHQACAGLGAMVQGGFGGRSRRHTDPGQRRREGAGWHAANIPTVMACRFYSSRRLSAPISTNLEVLSKPPVQYPLRGQAVKGPG